MAVGLIIMKDLNSLSKEELIKLIALQQEQLRVAEERAEKERIIAEKAQRSAEIKEQFTFEICARRNLHGSKSQGGEWKLPCTSRRLLELCR